MLRGFTSMSSNINELAKALANAQAQFKPSKKSGFNPHFKSHFSTLEDHIEATRDGLAENGLAIVQPPSGGGDGCVCQTTILMHSSGQFIQGELILPAKNNTAQDCGSAISYARRYSYASMLNLSSEDDDGNAATPTQKTNTNPINQSTGYQPRFQQPQPASTPDEYVIGFGQYKERTFSSIPESDLRKYIAYLQKGGDAKGPALEFINLGNQYLKLKESLVDAKNMPYVPQIQTDAPPPNDFDIPF